MKRDKTEKNNKYSKEIKVTNTNNKNKPKENPTQKSNSNNTKNKTLTNVIKSNNNQPKLWNQNKYDIGSWTRSKMMEIKHNKTILQQSTILKTKK